MRVVVVVMGCMSEAESKESLLALFHFIFVSLSTFRVPVVDPVRISKISKLMSLSCDTSGLGFRV